MTRLACPRQPAMRIGWAGILLALTGCENGLFKSQRDVPPEPAPPARAQVASVVSFGSIGAVSLFADADPRVLRGFGLVIGLDGTGSGDCPTVIRDYLVDFMIRQVGPQGSHRKSRISPGELIDSPDTAVVEVLGAVPAGARRGTRFDLQVQAMPGTATSSLEGGLLLPTELRVFDRAAAGTGLVTGAVLAEAGGPLFINPFLDEDDENATGDPRRATILGGGRNTEPRTMRLLLLQPGYQLVQSISRRINERFGQQPGIAEARSQGYLVLETPPEFTRAPEHFQQLVPYLYIDNSPAFRDAKRRELKRLAAEPEAPLEPIALAWEGLGRAVMTDVETFYTADDPELRFYAARTGARIDDPRAIPVLGEIASDPQHALRLLAVRALAEADSPQATLALIERLADADQEIRIAAYEGLLQHGHPVVESRQFRHVLDRSQLNCILDVVESDAPPLIFVRRTRLPRIAILGRQAPVEAPVFYSSPGGEITIVSSEESDDLRVFAKHNGRLTDEVSVPPVAAELVAALADLPMPDDAGQLRGVGLSYSRIIKVIARLCEDQAIPARLVLEQPSLTELLGPEELEERPISDLDEVHEDDLEEPPPPARRDREDPS